MNWGNKLLVTFLVFAGGMGFLVYRSVKTNYELVEKDYYKNEIGYQQVIDGTNRANQLSRQVEVDQSADGVRLSFPPEMKDKKISGDVWFYCSYDQKKDRKFNLSLNSEGIQMFPLVKIQPGNYVVKISWMYNDEKYFTQKNFSVL